MINETLIQYAKVASGIGIFNLFLFAVELLYSSVLKKDGKYNLKDTLTNFGTYSFLMVFNRLLGTGLLIGGFVFLYEISPLKMSQTNVFSWITGLFVADFCYYVYHRAGHEVRFLWNLHSTHHSSEHFNLSTSARLPLFGALIHFPFFAVMPLLGYHPVVVVTMYAIVFGYQGWIHTQYISSFPAWVEKIMGTPSAHRVHHGQNKIYHDKNYGGIFMVFDRIFGTYQEEIEAVRFGVTERMDSHNFLKVWFREIARTLRKTAQTRGLLNKVKIFLMPPGWEPSQANSRLSQG